MAPRHSSTDEPEIRVRKDGTGLSLNWKAVIGIVSVTITLTVGWMNLKSDVGMTKTDLTDLKEQVKLVRQEQNRQGRAIDQINAKLKIPVTVANVELHEEP